MTTESWIRLRLISFQNFLLHSEQQLTGLFEINANISESLPAYLQDDLVNRFIFVIIWQMFWTTFRIWEKLCKIEFFMLCGNTRYSGKYLAQLQQRQLSSPNEICIMSLTFCFSIMPTFCRPYWRYMSQGWGKDGLQHHIYHFLISENTERCLHSYLSGCTGCFAFFELGQQNPESVRLGNFKWT